MALTMSRVLVLSLLLLATLFLNLLQPHPAMAAPAAASNGTSPSAGVASINCEGACKYRCSKSWKPKMCNKMCLACCHKCACVPVGPTASRDSCACYARLKNPKGFNKCP